MKILLSVVIAAAVLVAGFFALNSYIYNEKQAESPETQPTFTWQIEPSSRYEETMPWHNVTLRVDGKEHFIGEELGCGMKTTVEGAVTYNTCWFGGGGTVHAVFFENGTYIVKKRWIQESGGPEVNAETEGPWETVVVL